MKILSFTLATLLLGCLAALAENEMVLSITDMFETEDPDINDTEGNVNWLASHSGPGWAISGGVLKKEVAGVTEIVTSNYVQLPTKGKVVVQCELVGQITDTENPQIRLGLVGNPGLNSKPITEFPGVYWIDFGGYGNITSRKLDAEQDVAGEVLSYGAVEGQEKLYYRLEVTSSEAQLFYSPVSMPDGTEKPVATIDLTGQDWSLWQGAYGYLRVVGRASIDNFEISNADAKLPEPAIPSPKH